MYFAHVHVYAELKFCLQRWTWNCCNCVWNQKHFFLSNPQKLITGNTHYFFIFKDIIKKNSCDVSKHTFHITFKTIMLFTWWKNSSGCYTELKHVFLCFFQTELEEDFRQLRKHVDDSNLLKTDPMFYILQLTSIIMLEVLGYLVLCRFGVGWGSYLTAALLFLVSQVRVSCSKVVSDKGCTWCWIM